MHHQTGSEMHTYHVSCYGCAFGRDGMSRVMQYVLAALMHLSVQPQGKDRASLRCGVHLQRQASSAALPQCGGITRGLRLSGGGPDAAALGVALALQGGHPPPEGVHLHDVGRDKWGGFGDKTRTSLITVQHSAFKRSEAFSRMPVSSAT